MRRKDPSLRTGRNAPSEEERRHVALYDRAHTLLYLSGRTAEQIADALGVKVHRINHLRSDLQAFSYSTRQRADTLLARFGALAVLQADSPGFLCTEGARTVGRHLQRDVEVIRRLLHRST